MLNEIKLSKHQVDVMELIALAQIAQNRIMMAYEFTNDMEQFVNEQ